MALWLDGPVEQIQFDSDESGFLPRPSAVLGETSDNSVIIWPITHTAQFRPL